MICHQTLLTSSRLMTAATWRRQGRSSPSTRISRATRGGRQAWLVFLKTYLILNIFLARGGFTGTPCHGLCLSNHTYHESPWVPSVSAMNSASKLKSKLTLGCHKRVSGPHQMSARRAAWGLGPSVSPRCTLCTAKFFFKKNIFFPKLTSLFPFLSFALPLPLVGISLPRRSRLPDIAGLDDRPLWGWPTARCHRRKEQGSWRFHYTKLIIFPS